jgi:hypothetical protein
MTFYIKYNVTLLTVNNPDIGKEIFYLFFILLIEEETHVVSLIFHAYQDILNVVRNV